MAKNRGVSIQDIQLGPVLQEMTEIALRHGVPLPASLTLTAKAMAQMQLAAAQLDPEVDPFDVAGKFLMRNVVSGMGASSTRRRSSTRRSGCGCARAGDRGDRAADRRPPRAEAGGQLPCGVARDDGPPGRASAGDLAVAAAALLATAITAVSSDRVARWVPWTLGVISAGCSVGLVVDLVRKRG